MDLNQNTVIQPERDSKVGKIRYIITGLLFCVFLVAFFDRQNITVLLADQGFTNAFGITGDKAAQGLLMTAFMFSYGIFNFLAGPVVKRFGPRKSLLWAVGSWSILMIVMGQVNLLWVLVACRIILGIGEAVMSPSTNILIQNWFPPKERAKANAVWFIGILLAPATAVPLVIWALNSYGWRGSFFVLAIIGAIPFLIMLLLLKNYPKESSVIGKAELEYIGESIKVNNQVDHKEDYSYLKDYRYWCNTVAYFALLAFYWGLVSWVPSYFKTTLGFSWKSMGVLTSLPFIAGTVGVLILSPIMDRLNKRAEFIVGGFTLGAFFLLLGLNTQEPTMIGIYIALAIACSVPVVPATWTIFQNIIKPKSMPVATGIFNGISYTYASFIPYIIGYLVNTTGSFKAGFYFMVAQAILGLIAAIPLVKQRL